MTYSKIEITGSNVIKNVVEENCESDHDSWLPPVLNMWSTRLGAADQLFFEIERA